MLNIIIIDDEIFGSENSDAKKKEIYELWESDLDKVTEEFKLTIYDSPIKALSEIKSFGKYTIVITDIQMPEMNGAEFLEELRNDGITIPVIGYTGNTNEMLIEQLLENDIFSYVKKENIDGLTVKINQAIEKLQDNIPLELSDALHEYLKRHPEVEDIEIITKEGKTLTLKDIENEINNGSQFGIDYQKALYKMSFEDLKNHTKDL